jgi:hypothetical protein
MNSMLLNISIYDHICDQYININQYMIQCVIIYLLKYIINNY